MLVLSRKLGEEIVVSNGAGEDVVISIVKFSGQKVRVGVQASEEKSISRGELLSLPSWCDPTLFPKPGFCRGLSPFHIRNKLFARCEVCPYCDTTKLVVPETAK